MKQPSQAPPVLGRARSARRLHPCRGPWRRAACGPTASRHCRRPQRPLSSRRLLLVLRGLRRRPRPCARTASRRCRRRRRPATLGIDDMDCDGRGPAPTAGTDFVVPPVRQSYKQPIDAAGTRRGPRCLGWSPRPPRRPRFLRPRLRPSSSDGDRAHGRAEGRRRSPRRNRPPPRRPPRLPRGATTTARPKTEPDAGTPAAGDDAADAKLALAPIAPTAAAERGEEDGRAGVPFLLEEKGRTSTRARTRN